MRLYVVITCMHRRVTKLSGAQQESLGVILRFPTTPNTEFRFVSRRYIM